MKIALICTEKLPVPPISGGAIQLYIEGILPYLSQYHEITLFSITDPGLRNFEVKENVRYIRLPGKDRIRYVSALKKAIKDEFDLIHVFNRPLSLVELSEELPNTKFSLSLHNEMFDPEKINDEEAKKCVARAEFITTVSKFIAEGVRKRCPEAEKKLKVVYSGVDIEKYKAKWSEEGIANEKALKAKYNLQKYKVVLFVGRLSMKKGAHVLLKAMKKVMRRQRDVALVVVGSRGFGDNEPDEYTRSLNHIARRLRGPVVFTGFLKPTEICAYYDLADVFVCPSQWEEPLARVHYEAMAAGVPIITTNRGGNAEVVSGYGNGILLEEYTNDKVLAGHIQYLLENPSKSLAMGRVGRKLAEDKFTWERVAKDLLEVFQTVDNKNLRIYKK